MKNKILIFSIILFLFASHNTSLLGKEKSDNPGQAKKAEKSAVIGNVDEIKGNSFVVEDTNNGKRDEITVDINTKVIGKDKKALKLRNIKPKDLVAIIGSDSANATDGAKGRKAIKIFVKQLQGTESAKLQKRTVHGIIQNIAGSIITLVHQIQQNRVYTVIVNESTRIKMKSQEASGSAFLQVGQRIVAMGDPQADGTLLAKKIHIIPGKAKGIFRRFPVATPSATVSPAATGSPTLSPSITATPSVTLSPEPTATPTPTL